MVAMYDLAGARVPTQAERVADVISSLFQLEREGLLQVQAKVDSMVGRPYAV